MIEMQYNPNNFQAALIGSFAAYPLLKKDGSFTQNEPISVLDTWSPSPSTSTSTRGGDPPSCGVEDEILKLLIETRNREGVDGFALGDEGDALQCLGPFTSFQQANHHFHLPQQLSSNQQRQLLYDDVLKAGELIGSGSFSNAQGILARLNQFLSLNGKTPFLRSAYYVKGALESALWAPQRIPAPFDHHASFKMGAYKVFSQLSPSIHFINFTANQLLLEALAGYANIHIIDFDIGFGAHWSSFLQEIPSLNKGFVTCLKITAFASPSTHHSLEITLMHQNLTDLANAIGVNFELEVVNIDCFDPTAISVSSLRSSETEAIAVNFPLWSFTTHPFSLPSYLSLLKTLSPKILVSLGRGCDHTDLPFPHCILRTLEYYEALLDSVDAANPTADELSQIERLHLQPRIESTVLGRFLCPNIMPPWRSLFASVGYFPVPISSFAEAQAECLLKGMNVRGFHVERREASLLLCWKHCELLNVSAWKC